MLTISKPLSARQAQSYHKKEFTSHEQSYWSRGNTIQGEWQGRLAAKYGLTGAVGEEEFARLSQGQHPHTGEQLVRHRLAHEYKDDNGKTVISMQHRAGWDATFSAPKSVSLTALVGGDHRIRAAHRESLHVALEELERYTLAGSAAITRQKPRESLSPPSSSTIPPAQLTDMRHPSCIRTPSSSM